jgi:hypothetical protein
MADEFEPRGELQGWVVEHRFQTISGHIFRVADFVQVWLEVDICFDEKDVVD